MFIGFGIGNEPQHVNLKLVFPTARPGPATDSHSISALPSPAAPSSARSPAYGQSFPPSFPRFSLCSLPAFFALGYLPGYLPLPSAPGDALAGGPPKGIRNWRPFETLWYFARSFLIVCLSYWPYCFPWILCAVWSCAAYSSTYRLRPTAHFLPPVFSLCLSPQLRCLFLTGVLHFGARSCAFALAFCTRRYSSRRIFRGDSQLRGGGGGGRSETLWCAARSFLLVCFCYVSWASITARTKPCGIFHVACPFLNFFRLFGCVNRLFLFTMFIDYVKRNQLESFWHQGH